MPTDMASVITSISLPPEDREYLRELAARGHRSVSGLVRLWLDEERKKEKRKPRRKKAA